MQYISLGCDCSVSYQLRKLKLQTMGSMPFDWLKLDKVQDLISVLDNNFDSFNKFDSFTVKEQSDNFDNFEKQETKILSRRRLIHNKYKFIMPHEYVDDYLDIKQFEEKYARRTARFKTLVKDSNIKKVFVRLCNKKENNEKNKILLEECLSRYGCKNFDIIIINYNDYDMLLQSAFEWQREYIPWNDILNIF